MAKYHTRRRTRGWRRRTAVGVVGGAVSALVVLIFAVVKFTEGAWLVVVVFPVLVFILIRLNREYRAEAAILEMFRTDRPELVKYARHRVFVFVNSVDLAVLEALRYGKGLRSDELIAVHFMVDAAHFIGLEGVLAPSATGTGETLALFLDMQRPDSMISHREPLPWTPPEK